MAGGNRILLMGIGKWLSLSIFHFKKTPTGCFFKIIFSLKDFVCQLIMVVVQAIRLQP